ncbi:MAG: M48 family metallopeptidase [Pseudomonadota bacterium]
MRLIAVVAMIALTGCQITTGSAPTTQAPPQQSSASARLPASQAAANFRSVVARMEPVAENICRQRRPNANCDFRIVVDDDPRKAPNAFQTLDRSGRPIIGFTMSLIRDARNTDELAFVLGHEAAHHIEAHIPEMQQRATEGAVLATVLGSVLGLDTAGVETAQRIGGTVGARRYSKEFELEADALGTRIAAAAGYDPLRGAEFFNRIPDPGDQFLGTHPPNAERIAVVRRVASQL